MPELNSFLVLAASHFILETFPDKWPFTFLWGTLCGMRGFKAAGHLWWLDNTFSYKLRSASRSCAHSSRCVPCSRVQGSPSPSSSRLEETLTRVPPAPSVCGGTCILQDRASAQFLEWYSVWLMLSYRQPKKKIFRGFFKNSSKKAEIPLVSSKGIKIRLLWGCVKNESSHQVPILVSLGSYYGMP